MPSRGFGRQTTGLAQGRSAGNKFRGGAFQIGAIVSGFVGNPMPNQQKIKGSATHRNKGNMDLSKTARKTIIADMGVNGVYEEYEEETAENHDYEGITEDINGMESMRLTLGKSAPAGEIFNEDLGVNEAVEGFAVGQGVKSVIAGIGEALIDKEKRESNEGFGKKALADLKGELGRFSGIQQGINGPKINLDSN